jgi:hypothetical protein
LTRFGANAERFNDGLDAFDAPRRRPMRMRPTFDELDEVTRCVLREHVRMGPSGIGEIVRGWFNVAVVLNVSERTAQRMAARGALIVGREVTAGGRGRIWTTLGEAVSAARRRLGLPADATGDAGKGDG